MVLGYLARDSFIIAHCPSLATRERQLDSKNYALSPILTATNCEKGKNVNALVKMWIAVVKFRRKMKTKGVVRFVRYGGRDKPKKF